MNAGEGARVGIQNIDDLFDHYDAPDNSKKKISDNIQ